MKPIVGVHSKVAFVFLGAIAFLIPISIIGTSLATIVLLLNWLIEGGFREKYRLLIDRKYFILFLSIFLAYAISLSYSENFWAGIKVLEIKLSLFILPLVISSMKLTVTDRDKLFGIFIVSVLLCTSIAFVQLALDQPSLIELKRTIQANGLRDNYFAYTKLHPTYLSFYIALSIFFTIYLIKTYHIRSITNILGTAVILYLLVLLSLLSARMAQIAFLLVSIFFLTYFLVRNKKYLALTVSLFLAVAVVTFFASSPTLSARFSEIANTSFEPPKGIHHNSTNMRIGILVCTLELLEKNWLIGLGIGSVQPRLNQCYKSNDFSEVLYLDNYGIHNTYLDIWLTAGVIGLFALLICLMLPLMKAIKLNHYIYTIFLILFALCCLTESMLNTNKGVIAYSFFNSILALSLYQTHSNAPPVNLKMSFLKKSLFN